MAPWTRRLLFPPQALAASFGPGDAKYAWSIFYRHFNHLLDAGFSEAERMLEVGPGRNLGTALLWWSYCRARHTNPVEMVCWDVFKNASPDAEGYWMNLARDLIDAQNTNGEGDFREAESNKMQAQLRKVAEGRLHPQITYFVGPLHEVARVMPENRAQFDLIYSQAAIEHIWHIEAFWENIARLTRAGGWHSHRIDLADHGRRETNYVEMLDWTESEYWLTRRFIPGAINRWRANTHMSQLKKLGFEILWEDRHVQPHLSVDQGKLAEPYRSMTDLDLRTTAIDLVARLSV